MVSRQKIERDVRSAIAMLDRQHYDVILLLSSGTADRFYHPPRDPPRAAADHPAAGGIDRRWAPGRGDRAGGRDHAHAAAKVALAESRHTTRWPIRFTGSDSELLTAGKTLLEQGADVLVLDCLGYYQHHRDVLQKSPRCSGFAVECAGFPTGGRTIGLMC